MESARYVRECREFARYIDVGTRREEDEKELAWPSVFPSRRLKF